MLDIYPTNGGTWWKATVTEIDAGIKVELWKRPDVTGNVWALMGTEVFDGPFHWVVKETADWLDTLPVNAGPVMGAKA